MNQTRLESLLESSTHMITGTAVSMLVWIFIVSPIYGFSQSMAQNFAITAIFSVASMIRGYILRRCFNAGLHKFIHKLAKKIFSLKSKNT